MNSFYRRLSRDISERFGLWYACFAAAAITAIVVYSVSGLQLPNAWDAGLFGGSLVLLGMLIFTAIRWRHLR
jgi:hypothetical protein